MRILISYMINYCKSMVQLHSRHSSISWCAYMQHNRHHNIIAFHWFWPHLCIGGHHWGSDDPCTTTRGIPRNRSWQGDSFRSLLIYVCWPGTSSQPFVTELDLRVAHLPAAAVEYLRQAMPTVQNDAGEVQYDYEVWINDVFDFAWPWWEVED